MRTVPKEKRAYFHPEFSAHIQLAEYRELYALALYRMTSLEKRVPAAGALMTPLLGAVAVAPPPVQTLLLWMIPASLVVFTGSAAGHARSFEDVLRRIEEIETSINETAGERLIVFQSRHPSRGRAVGGRTGTGTVQALSILSGIIFAACAWLFTLSSHAPLLKAAYGVFILACVLGLSEIKTTLRAYRYHGAKQIRIEGKGGAERSARA